MTEPMELAAEFDKLTGEKRTLEAEVATRKRRLDELGPQLLQLIEDGKLPPKFTAPSGRTIFLRRQLWARAKDGNWEQAIEALRQCGLDEYIQTNFSVQSVSAYVRDHDREGVPLPTPLAEALDVSEKFEVRAS